MVGCSKNSKEMLINVDKSALRVGIAGEVRRSPIMPVERPGQDNSAPLAGAYIGISKSPGGFVGNVVSDSLGQFSVELQPGVYTLTAQSFGSTFPVPPEPQQVTVPANGIVNVRLDYDTGIR
jgi:hypothetical protein